MQKKSNKTAHVLSLLTNEKAVNEENREEQPAEDTAEPVKQAADQAEPGGQAAAPAEKAKKAAPKRITAARKPPEKKYPRNTPIIEIKDEKTDPLSNLIKEELTKMLNEDYKEPLEDVPEPPVFDPPAHVHSDADTLRNENEEQVTAATEEEDEELFCVNVVELILKDRIKEYMDMVGMCTCERCTKDTMALTLNHIPPKYVVTNKGRLLAQLDFYDKQLAANFMVEVLKAGVMVKGSPRH